MELQTQWRLCALGRLGVVVPARRYITDRIVAQRSGDEPAGGYQESFVRFGCRLGNAKNTDFGVIIFGC